MIAKMMRYFDLSSNAKSSAARLATDGGKNTTKPAAVLPQYLAMLLGIVLQPFLAAFQETGKWEFTAFWGWVLFSAIVGASIFPAVYKRSFDASKPKFVHLCVIFTAGLGWQSLFQTGAALAPQPNGTKQSEEGSVSSGGDQNVPVEGETSGGSNSADP